MEIRSETLLGAKSAPVVLIEFSDFQCPFCARFANELLPELEKRYIADGQLAVAFRHLPIETSHPFALAAAQLSECALDIGAFRPFHAAIFRRKGILDLQALRQESAAIGLDPARAGACLNDPGVLQRVRTDVELAKSLGVSVTPTLFAGLRVGGTSVSIRAVIAGAQPLERFTDVIDSLRKDPRIAGRP
jgi:protein-disulfide isomerase